MTEINDENLTGQLYVSTFSFPEAALEIFDHWNSHIPTLIIVHVLETYPVTLYFVIDV